MTYTDQEFEYAMGGMKMSSSEAAKLEAAVAEDPSQWLARARLLSYYSTHPKDKSIAKNRPAHIAYLIQNKPDMPVFGSWSCMSPQDDPRVASAMQDEWKKALQRDPDNLGIIQNAVTALQLVDAVLCEHLLLKAKGLEPDNPLWSGRLAQHYQMNGSRRLAEAPCGENLDLNVETAGSIRELEASIASQTNQSAKLVTMQTLLVTVMHSQDKDKTREVANELLGLAAAQENDRNCGQYIYQANLVLAQLAFADDALDDAMSYLLKASETAGSQELAVMGPDFELARELWEKGKTAEVATYIRKCQRFWRNDLGTSERWLKQIAQGQTPDFNKHQVNARSVMKALELGAKLIFRKR